MDKPRRSTALATSPWTTGRPLTPHALFTQAPELACAIGTAVHEARALAGLGRCARWAYDIAATSTAVTQALTSTNGSAVPKPPPSPATSPTSKRPINPNRA